MFGMQEHGKHHKLNGVACSVTTCEHHGGGGTCHAHGINVGTEYAADKSETFCSTYKHKPGL